MFAMYCPDHGTRVLLTRSNIDAMVNTERGIEVAYHCTCGHRGVWITGRKAA